MKILIIGAGIGGLTTAIGLKQFGFDVQVFEAAPELKEVGAGLWVSPNAMKVYDLLGLTKEIQSQANTNKTFIGVANIHGDILSKIDCGQLFQRYGFYNTAIHRARLHSILQEHVPSITTGKCLSHYTEQGKTITAHFEDGTSVEGDILIGADGIKSAVRETMFGPTLYRYSGQTCWRFISNHQPTPPHDDCMVEMWGDKKGLRVGRGKIGDNEWYTFITLATEPGGQDKKETLKQELLKICENYPAHIKEHIEATPVESFIRNDIYDFPPIKQWFQGHVVLMGDAAHATTPNMGQGACQAIESAYILAKALSEYAQHPTQAFQVYQDTRLNKAHFVTKQSWNFGKMTNLSSPLLRWLRDLSVKMSPSFVEKRLSDRLYNFDDTLAKPRKQLT